MSGETKVVQDAPPLVTAVKRYPHTAKLMSGELALPGLRLDCLDIEPIHGAFAPMARAQAYDVSELAIVTFLQAKAYGKPLLMLPVVLAARLQQGCLVYNRRHRPGLNVKELAGARVGVRAYAQTTGMWLRGILDETYGIAPDRIRWTTFEGGHLEEYRDPAFVTRAPAGKGMLRMLMDGELDAAIFGNDLPQHEDIAPVITDHAEADRRWQAEHGFVPINHVLTMPLAVARAHPESVRAVYRLFKLGKDSVADPVALRRRLPDGVEALRGPLATTLAFCERQGLMPKPLTVDDLLADTREFLGDEAR
jgi:4,5-dihydroxyphthalate decarboxylase